MRSPGSIGRSGVAAIQGGVGGRPGLHLATNRVVEVQVQVPARRAGRGGMSTRSPGCPAGDLTRDRRAAAHLGRLACFTDELGQAPRPPPAAPGPPRPRSGGPAHGPWQQARLGGRADRRAAPAPPGKGPPTAPTSTAGSNRGPMKGFT